MNPDGTTILSRPSPKTLKGRTVAPGQGRFGFAVLLGGAALLFLLGCTRSEPGISNTASERQDSARLSYGTNGEAILTLSAEVQKANGLQTVALSSAEASRETKSYGRVVDVASLASLVADAAAASAAEPASSAELERLKTLASQTNASVRVVQAAEAAAARDRVQAVAARLKLVSAWGRGMAERQDLPALVRTLSSLESALVQLNFGPDEAPDRMPRSAHIVTMFNETNPVEAQYIGPVPAVDPSLQARGFLYLIPTNSAGLVPGMAVVGSVELGGEKDAGVIVPPGALVRWNGATWVYVQTSSDTFQRIEARLRRPAGGGWFVQDSLKSGMKIVTGGAQQLLSQEMNRQPE